MSESRDLLPFRFNLQVEKPCCECGEKLYEGQLVHLGIVPLRVGIILSTVLIAWCDECWTKRDNEFKNELLSQNTHSDVCQP